jgi:transposase InsO family protein
LVVATSVEQCIATGRQGIHGTHDLADDRRRSPARSRGVDAGIESCQRADGSFFHTLKTELVMHCDYKTRDQARASLFDYMEVFYNRQRRHSTLNYEAPLAFEAMQIA